MKEKEKEKYSGTHVPWMHSVRTPDIYICLLWQQYMCIHEHACTHINSIHIHVCLQQDMHTKNASARTLRFICAIATTVLVHPVHACTHIISSILAQLYTFMHVRACTRIYSIHTSNPSTTCTSTAVLLLLYRGGFGP